MNKAQKKHRDREESQKKSLLREYLEAVALDCFDLAHPGATLKKVSVIAGIEGYEMYVQYTEEAE